MCLYFNSVSRGFWLILLWHVVTAWSHGNALTFDVILFDFVSSPPVIVCAALYRLCIVWDNVLGQCLLSFLASSVMSILLHLFLCQLYWFIPLSRNWLVCQSYHLAVGALGSDISLCRCCFVDIGRVLDMAGCLGDDEGGLHHVDFVWSVIVIFRSMLHHCAMHPATSVFSLHCCS